jgi:hypothetical protein
VFPYKKEIGTDFGVLATAMSASAAVGLNPDSEG